MRVIRGMAARAVTAILLAAGVLQLSATGASAGTVSTLSPACGVVGSAVHLDGSGFTGATAVLFGVVPAPSLSLNGDNLLTTTVPAGATTAPVTVVNLLHGGNIVSSTPFTVVPVAAPTLSTMLPSSGDVGDPVTITGTNFCGATSVLFNGVAAPYTVDSNGQLSTIVPPGATSGPISLSLPGGLLGTGTFTVNPGGLPVGNPDVTSTSPTEGPIGTSVTIDGSGFTGTTEVSFNGVSADIGSVSDTEIVATVPANATTGQVTVTTLLSSDSSPGNFTVTRARTLSMRFDHGRARGTLKAMDGTASCGSAMNVRVQRYVHHHWQTVARPRTKSDGTYRTAVRHWSKGTFRAMSVQRVKPATGDVCGRAASANKHHA